MRYTIILGQYFLTSDVSGKEICFIAFFTASTQGLVRYLLTAASSSWEKVYRKLLGVSKETKSCPSTRRHFPVLLAALNNFEQHFGNLLYYGTACECWSHHSKQECINWPELFDLLAYALISYIQEDAGAIFLVSFTYETFFARRRCWTAGLLFLDRFSAPPLWLWHSLPIGIHCSYVVPWIFIYNLVYPLPGSIVAFGLASHPSVSLGRHKTVSICFEISKLIARTPSSHVAELLDIVL